MASIDQPAARRLRARTPSCPRSAAGWPAYVSLTKPRLVLMVLVTVAVGFLLGARGQCASRRRWRSTLLGTALVAGGAGALNQWLERDRDARMRRTANRALPSGPAAPSGGRGLRRCSWESWARCSCSSGANLLAAAVALVDVPALRLRLHAAETADDAQHGGRRDPRRLASGDRLGGRDRAAGHRGLGALPDRLPLAVPPLPGDRLDLSRRLPARRLPHADRRDDPGAG